MIGAETQVYETEIEGMSNNLPAGTGTRTNP
jgi:hypothetical protein